MTRRFKVGIIGCGHIFDAYARLSRVFAPIDIVACADIDQLAANRRASQYGLTSLGVSELLAESGIDAVINLTNPASHATITDAALSAGKHTYSEKPLALAMADAHHLIDLAMRNGLGLAAAPDTFLGGAHQAARGLIDAGRLGTIKAGSAHFMNHGMEAWHPNPFPYYQAGAGPVLDMGPYYVTVLVSLLGPVKRVASLATTFFDEREVTAEGPNQGTIVAVATPTNSQSLIDFHSGAQVHFSTSYDVWGHGHVNPIELHGTEASLMLPDPNYFAGGLEIIDANGRSPIDTQDAPFGIPNWREPRGALIGNYRGLGLADMLDGIANGRAARASGDLALHVLEVLLAIIRSAERGQFIEIESTIERPEPLDIETARRLKAVDAPAEFLSVQ
ncbi:Gfo/Idh/MocA family oxidoreductase [Kaistia geumhonensis]|uniref:Dehydrogenase n=1 Tax=Kaistia geumhonensis TaxID=410839 RepID=A0ABU0M6Y3_9HYPH|nr:Gfo/Idh/MocA family oxidoreductase [Kaistia geumhonensis]MCX5478055.1 Gfo/Idh/MocA family oxidoreductase [Kaistia geumhonensis]MDQ0516729.1 putative dehydrogenase [Kaistia geumhonensis]